MNQRAFKMQLKPGHVAEYKRRHDAIWPELSALLSDAGIYDYSIFLDEQTLSLFAVMRVEADNTLASLPEHPIMRRWWDHMAELMEVEPSNRPKEWPLQPMFHLD
ncbi:L-rhamnose mutarotase [Massilia sp. TS11]|uniref:L-rhamnose mutarotase n=1 Tax=Massilia sp. TS11 TaxID=2908003 RepID=UPI001EDBEC98|nr:L-rhamnose mutarotase [Massilia sp. TS11]MCG2583933.1 L-rhamnose mutarotase [Massilia sp. TS11]